MRLFQNFWLQYFLDIPSCFYTRSKIEYKDTKSFFKCANTQLSTFGQKKIQRLLEKDILKVVIFEKIISIIQVFNYCFVDNIKNSCINKVYKKSCPFMYAYNNEKKNLILIYSPKILRVSQSIGFCLNNDNCNIRFYLWDII